MAQASSAQREPSMEEILASIRRIIEDSDSEKRSDELQPAVIAAAANDGADVTQDVEVFRAEFRDAPPAAQTAFASGVRADADAAQPRLAEIEREMSSSQIQPLEDSVVSVKAAATVDPSLASPAEPENALPLATAPSGDFPALAHREAEAPSRPPLISQQAGRQVAASFGELSEAFAASRRRSFDEMAEEMLRPMLQDWLDNNLPHLVERLVREEIERIARG